jgi:hypothetical protein
MLEKLMEDLFYEVQDVVVDLQSGRVGVKFEDGIYSYVAGATPTAKGKVTKSPFVDLAVELPAFVMPVPPTDLKPGDILILADDSWVFFSSLVKKEDDADEVSFKGIEIQSGKHVTVTSPVNVLLGNKGIKAVRTAIGGLGGANTASLLPLLLMKDGGDTDSLLPLLLLSGGGGLGSPDKIGGLDSKALLPLLLMGGKGKSGSLKKLLPLLLMGGGGGSLDLSSLLPLLALKGD